MSTNQDSLVPLRWPDGWNAADLVTQSPFNCLLTEGTQSGAPLSEGLRVVTDTPAGVRLAEGVAPHLKVSRGKDGAVESGPTGKPWLETNGWLVQLHRATRPDEALWLGYKHEGAPRIEQYLRSIAEPAAYGAHWVVTLDPQLAESLAAKDAEALAQWKRLCSAARFFETHRDWRQQETAAAVGVISTFTGDNEYLAQEFLNLAARRPLPVRVLPVSRAAHLRFEDLKAIVVADAQVPAEVEAKLSAFKGMVFRQSKEQWADPYVMAETVHLRLGREHDVVRLYNAVSANVNYTLAADRKRATAQVIAFTPRMRDVTIAVSHKWKSARLYTLDKPEGAAVNVASTRFGSEVALPEFQVYAAVELEA